jgi:hypothetical protein
MLTAAACATGGAQREAATRTTHSAIAMQTNSWGKLVSEWRIDRSGAGTYSATRDVPGGGFRDYDVIVRRFAAGSDGFRRIEALLGAAERGYECEHRISDGPYGSIEWSWDAAPPHRLNFNYGCQSVDAARAYGAMAEAGQLVESWAAAGDLLETRQVREPRR